MKVISICDAKTQLSRLVEKAADGAPFVIRKPTTHGQGCRSGNTDRVQKRRTGFLSGQISVPDDFEHMGEGEIAALFGNTQ